MPRLAQVVTQTVEVEQTLKLAPKQVLTLRKALQTYQRVKQKIADLQVEAESAKGEVEDVMAELGTEQLDFEGYKSKIVAGVRKKFDPELFAKKGGNLKTYNAAMVEVPVSAYVKISSAKDDE